MLTGATPPEGTRLTAGQWWAPDYKGPPLVSLDANLARGWGVGLGDTVTLNILGRDLEFRIASLRDIEWRGLGLNFALVASPGLLESAPHTHIATIRADQAADQRVRGARGQADQPGQQVPGDAADEAAEDDRQRDRGLVDQVLGDGRGDREGEEGADQVEDGGQRHRDLRLEGAGGDRGRHRVARVVEPVREVEGQGRRHHEEEDDRLGHEESVRPPKGGENHPPSAFTECSPG